MIGKSEWFERRKYGGWGIHRKTWQGWLYIIAIIIPLIIFHSLPFWNTTTRIIVTGIWAVFLIVDVTGIMISMKKDEREKIHEALAERNATWTITVILTIGLAYQIIISALNQKIMIDWWIAVALVMGAIIKAISNYKLEKEN